MGRIKNYKNILKNILEKEVAIPFANAKDLKSKIVINKEETVFMIVKMGWIEGIFRYGIQFHFEIRNNKVWLFKNNTDIDIAKILVENGIPKSDIVIGFVSEIERTVDGYALA